MNTLLAIDLQPMFDPAHAEAHGLLRLSEMHPSLRKHAVDARSMIENRWPTAERNVRLMTIVPVRDETAWGFNDDGDHTDGMTVPGNDGTTIPATMYASSSVGKGQDLTSFRKFWDLDTSKDPRYGGARKFFSPNELLRGPFTHEEVHPVELQANEYKGFWDVMERAAQRVVPGFAWRSRLTPDVFQALLVQSSMYGIGIKKPGLFQTPFPLEVQKHELVAEALTDVLENGDNATDLSKAWSEVFDALMGRDAIGWAERDIAMQERFRGGILLQAQRRPDEARARHDSMQPLPVDYSRVFERMPHLLTPHENGPDTLGRSAGPV